MEGSQALQQIGAAYSAPPLPAETPLTGNFASHNVQKQTVEPYIQDEQRISSDVIELAKFNISTQWEMVATRLGFSERDKALLKLKHLGENEEEHLSYRATPPGYCPLIEEMIRIAQSEKNLTKEVIIQALDQATDLPEISFKHAQKASEMLLDCESHSQKKYDSYIFLIWVKHPERLDACPLPNTTSCPVRQAGYDWALKNSDKLVILWFSSSTLNAEQNDKKMIREFQDTVRSNGISNLLVLDVDDIDWGDETRRRSIAYDTEVPLKTFLKLCNSDIPFTEYIDGLRIALLSMGSKCIFSASRDKNNSILQEDIPNRGLYVDIDYYPVSFQTYADQRKPLCRDGSFDIPRYDKGVRHNRYVIPNSLLAVCNEKQSSLNQWPLSGCFTKNARVARYQPYLCAKTETFRMSDVEYRDDGKLAKWRRCITWRNNYKDKDTNRPLALKGGQQPEHLARHLQNPQSRNDPMLPKQQ